MGACLSVGAKGDRQDSGSKDAVDLKRGIVPDSWTDFDICDHMVMKQLPYRLQGMGRQLLSNGPGPIVMRWNDELLEDAGISRASDRADLLELRNQMLQVVAAVHERRAREAGAAHFAHVTRTSRTRVSANPSIATVSTHSVLSDNGSVASCPPHAVDPTDPHRHAHEVAAAAAAEDITVLFGRSQSLERQGSGRAKDASPVSGVLKDALGVIKEKEKAHHARFSLSSDWAPAGLALFTIAESRAGMLNTSFDGAPATSRERTASGTGGVATPTGQQQLQQQPGCEPSTRWSAPSRMIPRGRLDFSHLGHASPPGVSTPVPGYASGSDSGDTDQHQHPQVAVQAPWKEGTNATAQQTQQQQPASRGSSHNLASPFAACAGAELPAGHAGAPPAAAAVPAVPAAGAGPMPLQPMCLDSDSGCSTPLPTVDEPGEGSGGACSGNSAAASVVAAGKQYDASAASSIVVKGPITPMPCASQHAACLSSSQSSASCVSERCGGGVGTAAGCGRQHPLLGEQLGELLQQHQVAEEEEGTAEQQPSSAAVAGHDAVQRCGSGSLVAAV